MNLQPRPFLKWVGGKTQLLPELIARIPKAWNRETDLYVEPFLGGGALFWELQPKRAWLGDANEELYNAWLSLNACYFDELLEWLGDLARGYQENPEGVYQYQRRLALSREDVARRAARTIFLNKTCFNGLYRVNREGHFNTPWGKNPKACVLDRSNLRACSEFLRLIELNLGRGDFAEFHSCRGAFYYFDPPYIPVSKTSSFTAYTTAGFTYYDQLRLATHAYWLRNCGNHVMLSQAADELLVDQYRRLGFTCDLVPARRNVNSKGDKRGRVGEYIIYGSG